MTRLNHDSSLSSPIDAREAEITKIAESKEDVADLFDYARQITEGRAFKGSNRSRQFLAYIIQQAVAGRFDALKERVIGVELFGRSPSYDTGEDAIVRVTASDVRKRLMQHYGESGRSAKFLISLPSGSYIPEITRGAQEDAKAHVSTPNTEKSPVPDHPAAAEPGAPASAAALAESAKPAKQQWKSWLRVAAIMLVIGLASWAAFSWHRQHVTVPEASVLPWSALFGSPRLVHLITSDPNIVFIQEITGNELSVSDYANRRYIPDHNSLTPEVLRLCHIFLWGDNSAAAVDAPIALRIASVAQNGSRKIDAHASRSVQLPDLKNDDNFILLGSPRSNPWSTLFTDQLDFRFVFDRNTKQEIIQNVHPRKNEQMSYVPTAQGWGTGTSYAIIAFVQNPDQNGNVVLLAGADGEGTEASGKFATDLPRMSDALNQCGVHNGKPYRHFEMLLGLKTLAGSPNNVNVIACHPFPGPVAN